MLSGRPSKEIWECDLGMRWVSRVVKLHIVKATVWVMASNGAYGMVYGHEILYIFGANC